MNFETISRPVPFGAVAVYGFVRGFSALGERLGAWYDARRTMKALGRLSDRELDDIGLTRADVGRAAQGLLR